MALQWKEINLQNLPKIAKLLMVKKLPQPMSTFFLINAKLKELEGWIGNHSKSPLVNLPKKKYPGSNPTDAFNQLCSLISNKGPIARGTVPKADGVYDKLTDTSLYTGTHKQRFDENGQGRGLDGRDTLSKTQGLDKMVERTAGNQMLAGNPAFRKPSEPNAYISNPSINKTSGSNSNIAGSNSNFNKGSTGALNKNTSNSNSKTTGSNSKLAGGNVYDRLTNTQGYTGTHKNRFDASGKGKGLAGRDYIPVGGGSGDYAGGDVKNLAQILRN